MIIQEADRHIFNHCGTGVVNTIFYNRHMEKELEVPHGNQRICFVDFHLSCSEEVGKNIWIYI